MAKASASAAAAKEVTPIIGSTLEEKTLEFTLKGRSPLLMANPIKVMMEAQGTKTRAKRTQEEEAEMLTYRFDATGKDKLGQLAFPAMGVRGRMMRALTGVRVKKLSASTLLGGSIFMKDDGEQFPLYDFDMNPLFEYDIDLRRVVIQTQGIIRARPKITEWILPCAFKYYPDILQDLQFIQNAIIEAGLRIGIGDYRPDKKGWFGTFELISFEVKG